MNLTACFLRGNVFYAFEARLCAKRAVPALKAHGQLWAQRSETGHDCRIELHLPALSAGDELDDPALNKIVHLCRR
jgi:hypothetical protein